MHAKGSGAYGTFTVTHDVTQYTKAKVFEKGKNTEVFVRFSTVADVYKRQAQMERLPQILKNVKVENKQAVMNSQILQEAILHQEERLKGQGRILVRPSGTESLVRVMAEGRDLQELEHIIDELTKLVQDIA